MCEGWRREGTAAQVYSHRAFARSCGVNSPYFVSARRGAGTDVELGRRVAVRPVWTGPGCTIVLAGATSQWKRSDCGSAAIGPPAGSPAGDRARSSRSARAHRGRVAVGRERGQQPLVELRAGAEEAQRAAEQHDAGVDRLAALDARDDPQRGVLERLTRRTRSASSAHSRGACRRASGTRRRRRRRPSSAGHQRGGRAPGRHAAPAARRPPASSRRRAAARGRGSPGTRRAPAPAGRAPWKAYSAAPWSISHRLPCQRSRFGLRGVRSTLVTSASSHTTSAASVGVRRLGRACTAASPAGSRRRG